MRVLLFAIAVAAVAGTGCRHRCGDRAQSYDRCDTPPRYAAADRRTPGVPCADAIPAGASPVGRQPIYGSPVNFDTIPGYAGGIPFAPTVPTTPAPGNELPPPIEVIPTPGVPTGPGRAFVLPTPQPLNPTYPTGLPR